MGSGKEFTAINAGGQGSCVVFKNGEGNGSILSGFTLEEGVGQFIGGSYWGGGIYGFGSEPIIDGNIIEHNEASVISNGDYQGRGGGLYFIQDVPPKSPIIQNNIIRFNRAGANGGGLAFDGNINPIIRNNVILGNQAITGDGGGIWLFTSANGAIVTNNTIDRNQAGDHGGGIFIDGENLAPPYVTYEISHNLIAKNFAAFGSLITAGGGGLLLAAADAWVHHNTIVMNETQGLTLSMGGGIAVDNSAGTVIEQNIIALTERGGGIMCYRSGPPGVIRDNLAWQNVGGDGAGSCTTWWASDGNIVADPYFCGIEAGNFAIAANSPALTHPAGPLGAFPNAACGPVDVRITTWGRLKTLYGS